MYFVATLLELTVPYASFARIHSSRFSKPENRSSGQFSQVGGVAQQSALGVVNPTPRGSKPITARSSPKTACNAEPIPSAVMVPTPPGPPGFMRRGDLGEARAAVAFFGATMRMAI